MEAEVSRKRRKDEGIHIDAQDTSRQFSMGSLIIWNCRKTATRHTIPHFISEFNPHIFGFVESKATDFSLKDVNKIIGKAWFFFFVPLAGISEGIVLYWCSDIVHCNISCFNPQVIIAKIKIHSTLSFYLGVVYANQDPHLKERLWEPLATHNLKNLSAIIGGDFNCMLNQKEKSGSTSFKYSKVQADFDEFLLNNNFYNADYFGNNLRGAAIKVNEPAFYKDWIDSL